MNNLQDLCLEIKDDIEDNWGLSLDTDDELYDLIEKNMNHNKRFIFISDDDFSTDFEEDQLIFYFDFEDKLLTNEVDHLEEYANNMLESIANKIIESNKFNLPNLKDRNLKVYFFTNNYGKMLQVEKLNDVNSKNEEENWNYKLIQKINENLDVKYSLKFKKGPKNNMFLFRQLNLFKEESSSVVQIDSRVRRVTTKHLKNKAKGEVYTASLYDLTQLFAINGNDLFKDNLRLRIKDESTNVDKEITRTLLESPDEFWYLNNGITLLVDQRYVEFKHSKQIAFNKISHENDLDQTLSVINGAQTLNAAAEFFYDIKIKSYNDNDERDKKQEEKINQIKKAMEEAYVILRIIQVDYPQSNEINEKFDWINKIAIALNSQKPIKKEDIVSSLYFIQAINLIHDADKKNEFTFGIIRRGEKQLSLNKKYYIKDLAKILVTYIEKKPEKARSSNQEHLETSRKESSEVYSFSSGAFLNQGILIDDSKTFEDRVEEYKINVFETMYKPVNYLMVLNSRIDQLNKKLKTLFKDNDVLVSLNITSMKKDELKTFRESISTVLTYAKFHFILCIFEKELNELISIDRIYEKKYTLDFNKETKKDKEKFSEEEKEANKKMIKDSLTLWERNANDAQNTFSELYLLKLCVIFIDLWKKYVSPVGVNDKSLFRKEVTEDKMKNILKDFISNSSRL